MRRSVQRLILCYCGFLAAFACAEKNESAGISSETNKIQLVTLDPGHFHAALIQKTAYPEIDPQVKVFAPPGKDLELHLDRINSFNQRKLAPTDWALKVYQADDFVARFLEKKHGDVVVVSGNNARKTHYIQQAIEAGYHVFADKPMAINSEQFDVLQKSIELARARNQILLDMMTERFEITNRLQKALSQDPQLFGTIAPGNADSPSIIKESVHHFYKQVAGNTLVRPAWFFDELQEGDGLVDVGTHLVDLVQWTLFDGEALQFKDLNIIEAIRWPTVLTRQQFYRVTARDAIPDYLTKNIENDKLKVFSNGELSYQLRGVHARIKVSWEYQAPEGASDYHYSLLRGTKSQFEVRQTAAGNYRPEFYITTRLPKEQFEKILRDAIGKQQHTFPGLAYRRVENAWQLIIPDELRSGHEAHFAEVTRTLLQYLNVTDTKGQKSTGDSKSRVPSIPDAVWQHMLMRYYTTTQGLSQAKTR